MVLTVKTYKNVQVLRVATHKKVQLYQGGISVYVNFEF